MNNDKIQLNRGCFPSDTSQVNQYLFKYYSVIVYDRRIIEEIKLLYTL